MLDDVKPKPSNDNPQGSPQASRDRAPARQTKAQSTTAAKTIKAASTKARSTLSLLSWQRLPLPAKLLVLTAVFVMLAEVLIFVPSIANFRETWLKHRINDATLAALAANASPHGQVPLALRTELLETAQVKAVAWRRYGRRELVLPPDTPMFVDTSFDLRPREHENIFSSVSSRIGAIGEAMAVLLISRERTLRIIGPLGNDKTNFIEIVMPEKPLRDAMLGYGLNILVLSIIISLFTAALVYIALSALLVRPMLKITKNMLHFAQDPEDANRIITPSSRKDEIGTAERELEAMQRQLSGLLLQKNRLAQLGLAVSKINHDLRNMLANAQLISDRLSDVPDPTVQRFAPKLISSLDRAISFCTNTLQFGRAEEDAPRRELILLAPLINEVGDGLGLTGASSTVKWHEGVPASLHIDADPQHLHRILTNLCRNAVQVLTGHAPPGGARIDINAWRDGRCVFIDVKDNGPGIPAKVRENLFKAFHSSQSKGGTGLGLTIAYELTSAHGGMLELLETEKGTTFRIEIPDRSVG